MSVSNRLYWELVDYGLELKFVRWLSEKYPIMFRELINQFTAEREE